MQLLNVFQILCIFIVAVKACSYLQSEEFKSKRLNVPRCLLLPGSAKKEKAVQNKGAEWCDIFAGKIFCTERCSNNCRPRLERLLALKCPNLDCKNGTQDVSKIYLHCVCEGLNFQGRLVVCETRTFTWKDVEYEYAKNCEQ